MGELVATLDKKVNEIFKNRLKSGKNLIEVQIDKEKQRARRATAKRGNVSVAGRLDEDHSVIEEEENEYSAAYGSEETYDMEDDLLDESEELSEQ